MANIKNELWNAVVAGRWNPAILTPKGIAKHIFEKEDDFPIEVMVPIDAIGPPKAIIDGLTIVANFERLVIDCNQSDWAFFEKSREYCRKAIEALPKTPLSAAGFNIRFELTDPGDDFLALLELPLDNLISDQHYEIINKEIRRSFSWKEGSINLHLIRPEANIYKILLNFDKKSADGAILTDWLNIPIADVQAVVKEIMCSILKACEEEQIQ